MGCGASKATQQSAVGPEEKTGTSPPGKNSVKPDAELAAEPAADDAALPTSTFEGYKNYQISASGRDLGPARPPAAPQQLTPAAVTSVSSAPSSTTKPAATTPTPTPAPAPTPVPAATDDVVPATIPIIPRPNTTSPRPWSANVRQSASRIDPARVPLPSSADISARAAIRTPLPASADVVARTAIKTPLPPSMSSLAAVHSGGDEESMPHDADRAAVRTPLPPSTYSIAAASMTTAPRPKSADVARSNGKIAQNDADAYEPAVRPRPATAEVARSAVKTPLPPSTYSLAVEASVLAAVEDAAPDVPLPASTDQLRFPD